MFWVLLHVGEGTEGQGEGGRETLLNPYGFCLIKSCFQGTKVFAERLQRPEDTV